jgi:hypothetical protein
MNVGSFVVLEGVPEALIERSLQQYNASYLAGALVGQSSEDDVLPLSPRLSNTRCSMSLLLTVVSSLIVSVRALISESTCSRVGQQVRSFQNTARRKYCCRASRPKSPLLSPRRSRT